MAICVGCGLDVDVNGRLHALVRPGGGIECDPEGPDAGLYITPGAIPSATPSSNTFDSSTGQVKISNDPGQGIVPLGDGIWSPCPDSVHGIQPLISPVAAPNPITGPNQTYIMDGVSVNVTNTMYYVSQGKVSARFGGLNVVLKAGFVAQGHLEVDMGLGMGLPTPDTLIQIHNNVPGAPDLYGNFNNMEESTWVVFNPGQTYTITPRFVFTVIGAAAPAGFCTGAANFEVQWDICQTGACTP